MLGRLRQGLFGCCCRPCRRGRYISVQADFGAQVPELLNQLAALLLKHITLPKMPSRAKTAFALLPGALLYFALYLFLNSWNAGSWVNPLLINNLSALIHFLMTKKCGINRVEGFWANLLLFFKANGLSTLAAMGANQFGNYLPPPYLSKITEADCGAIFQALVALEIYSPAELQKIKDELVRITEALKKLYNVDSGAFNQAFENWQFQQNNLAEEQDNVPMEEVGAPANAAENNAKKLVRIWLEENIAGFRNRADLQLAALQLEV